MHRLSAIISTIISAIVFVAAFGGALPLAAQIQRVKIIRAVNVKENVGETIVSIVANEAFPYVTRRFDNRFQLLIPQAGASVTEGRVHDADSLMIWAERKGNDAVFTFTLFNEAAATFKLDSNILYVSITSGSRKPSDQAGLTTIGGTSEKKSPNPTKGDNAARAPEINSTPGIQRTKPAKEPFPTTTVTQPVILTKENIDSKKPVGGAELPSQANVGKVSQSGFRISRAARPPVIEDFLQKGKASLPGTEINDFRQRAPNDGEAVTQPTSAYVSYDAANLYIAFVCRADVGQIRARMAKREDIQNDDLVSVTLDTFNDRRRAYVFTSNPLGVQLDSIATEGQGDDATFDTLWYSDGRLTGDGFVVLMTIPFKSLRFSDNSAQSWGIALGRTIAYKNEEAYFPHITQRKQGFIQQAAQLEGLEKISGGRNIQIIPYYVGSIERTPNYSGDNARNFRTNRELRAGLDAKVVLKNAYTLDLTINPDFSQVESDEPQVTVNRRFENFFPEKRPFFIENAAFFQTPENLFFSRRIIDPQFGARLTGKKGGWALGALMIDDKAPGRWFLEEEPEYGKRAFIGALRVQREFAEQSAVGVMLTNYNFGSETNRVISLDSRIRLSENWSFTGQVIRSATRERGGSRFAGTAYFAGLSRNGRKLNYDISYTDRSPGFNARLGYIPRVDIRQLDQSLSYRWRPNKNGVVSYGTGGFVSGNWNHAGQLQDWFANGSFNIEFVGLTGVEVNRSQSYELVANRGFDTDNTRISFYSDRLSWLGVYASYYWGRGINYTPSTNLNPFSADSSGGNFEIAFRPSRRFSFQQNYIYSHLIARSGDLPGLTRRENVFYNHIFRSKLNYQFNREWSLRAIVDYNAVLPNESLIGLERTKQLTADILLTYMLNPGTAIYIGYSDLYENVLFIPGSSPSLARAGMPFNSTGRRIFIKMNRLFRF